MIAIEKQLSLTSTGAFIGPLRDEYFELNHQSEIMRLVSHGQIAAARTLAQETAAQCPNDEISWVMLSLVSEVQQDWPAARLALEQLLHMQGDKSPPSVHSHYVRVLRCLGENLLANAVLQAAIKRWPEDQMLSHEKSLRPQQFQAARQR